MRWLIFLFASLILGIEFQQVPERTRLTLDPSSDDLTEWQPIKATIGEGEIQYYQFNVNGSQPGLSQFFELLIFISGNVCSLPDSLQDSPDNKLSVLYTFNATIMYYEDLRVYAQRLDFEYGYAQGLATTPTDSPYSTLYVAVVAGNLTEGAEGSKQWSYQLGISQNDLVFQWDDRSWVNVLDADYNSALFITGNTSSTVSNLTGVGTSRNEYFLKIFENDPSNYFGALNRSWCAILNGNSITDQLEMTSSLTHEFSGVKQQMYLQGLNSSSSYTGYLTQDFEGEDFGGILFSRFEFDTMSRNACKLIYGLDFCTKVAYSVPASEYLISGEESVDEFAKRYDDNARAFFSNFSKAIQLISCETQLDARFSPIVSCDNCVEAYKDWLCSVTIPRCSTRNETGYQDRNETGSRSSFINDQIVPPQQYFEMLPCVNMCHAIARTCPADFGFDCPRDNVSIARSYYWDTGDRYPSCNYVGKLDSGMSSEVSIAVGGAPPLEPWTPLWGLLLLVLFWVL